MKLSNIIATVILIVVVSSAQKQLQAQPTPPPTFVGVPPFTDSRWDTTDVFGIYIPWYGTYSTYVTQSGPAVRSGDLYSVNQKANLQIVVPNHYENGAPVSHTIRFWIQSGSYHPLDTFEFKIDGITKTNLDGGSLWKQIQYIQTAFVGSNSTSTLSWLVTRKITNYSYPNYQFLDAVQYLPNYAVTPPSGSTNAYVFMSKISPSTFRISWLNSVYTNALLNWGSTVTTVTNSMSNVPTLSSGLWSVTVTNEGSQVKFFTPRQWAVLLDSSLFTARIKLWSGHFLLTASSICACGVAYSAMGWFLLNMVEYGKVNSVISHIAREVL